MATIMAQILMIATTTTITTTIFHLTLLHRELKRKISVHDTLFGEAARRIVDGHSGSKGDDVAGAGTGTGTTTGTGIVTDLSPVNALLPTDLRSHPSTYNVFYDISGLSVDMPLSVLSMTSKTMTATQHLSSLEPLITRYLRYTMTLFSQKTPQAWILWFVAVVSKTSKQRGDDRGDSKKEGQKMMEEEEIEGETEVDMDVDPETQVKSFQGQYIQALAFERGDVVCGNYVVLNKGCFSSGDGGGGNGDDAGEMKNKTEMSSQHKRRQGKSPQRAWVVFGMRRGEIHGRWVVCVGYSGGSDEDQHGHETSVPETRRRLIFTTETWMWVKRDKPQVVVMPMEMKIPRLMHRMASGWLLVRGTEWLQTSSR